MMEILAVLFGSFAALFWLWSATIAFPKKGEPVSLGENAAKLAIQSKRSAYAAICACIAAVFQIVSMFV
jgi:hypothetical protein